jgi:hypothetical protein
LPEDEEVRGDARRTTRVNQAHFTGKTCFVLHGIVRKVPIAEMLLCRAAGRGFPAAHGRAGFHRQQWASWGGTRAGQFLVLGAKARALKAARSDRGGHPRSYAHPLISSAQLPRWAEGVAWKVIQRLLKIKPPIAS